MDLMEEMWISRPQRRITKLSDLYDKIKMYALLPDDLYYYY